MIPIEKPPVSGLKTGLNHVLLYALNITLSFLSALMVYQWYHDKELSIIEKEHSAIISSVNSAFSQEVGDITNIVRLANEHLIDRSKNNDGSSYEEHFLHIGRVLNNLSQMRWLNLSGVEKIRVDFRADGIQITPLEDLQDKSHRDYVARAQNTPQGSIILSSIDLNVERGEITTPYQPTLRVILHTFPSHPLGEGFLILNFDLSYLLRYFTSLETVNTKLLVASGNKEWMLHPNSQLTWQRSRGLANEISLEDSALQQYILQTPQMSITEDSNGALYSALQLHLKVRQGYFTDHYIVLTYTDASDYHLIKKSAFIPAFVVFISVFSFLSLLILRELKRQTTLAQLNKQLLVEKTELLTALNSQTQLRSELMESEKMASLSILLTNVTDELSNSIGDAMMYTCALQDKVSHLENTSQHELRHSDLLDFIAYSKESTDLSVANLHSADELVKRFSRLARDRRHSSPTLFSVNRVVNDLIKTIEKHAHDKQVDIRVDIDGDINTHSLPGLYAQIIQNLIYNALDNNSTANHCSHISLKVAKTPGGAIELRLRNDDIESDTLISAGSSEPSASTGKLDQHLYLVHFWVTHILNGQITVTSTAEGGTEIVLILPENIVPSNTSPQ